MKSQELYKKAKKLIPGGTQLLSKRPEMFLPEQWPAYYSKAKGIEITDLDGRIFMDMSVMGIGACILGYADPDVDAAVKEAIDKGSACSLNAPEEVELAELLCKLHPWAQRVRYARSGGEAMAIAVRIARAHTGRDKVAFCGYHGWSDWYLAANLNQGNELEAHLLPGLNPAGVPKGLKGTALPFHYNRIDELKKIIDSNRNDLAAIIMEPRRSHEPEPGFLEAVREIARETDAVLIFDEITSGFRMNAGGIHLQLGINPDIAVFAKAIANGYAMSAIIGIEKVMQSAQSTFISSTNWTERIGPVAALATIKKYQKERVAEHLLLIGTAVSKAWTEAAQEAALPLKTDGLPTLNHFFFDHPDDLILTTFFTQLMLERGYLAFNQFKPSFAHKASDIAKFTETLKEVFSILSEALKKGDVAARLKGPVACRGFYRLA